VEEKNYVGITIGPIFDTMNLSSSPVALWASSYIFSTLSKTVCRLLCENRLPEDKILSPYYSKDDPLINKENGVGLFHDHIIFECDDFDTMLLPDIKCKALSKISDVFGVEEDYLKEYIMLSYFKFPAVNPIKESCKIFDSFELAKSFVAEDIKKPIQALFDGDKYSKNNLLIKTKLIDNLVDFQLKKTETSFKSLEDIVSTGENFKKFKYYAIVRADGDNMSQIINSLSDTKIRDFSKTCLKYCDSIAKKVEEYNGITIYAGGDDLLAILPCETKHGKNPFDFVNDANAIFNKYFDGYKKATSLSFSVTISYYKFPLYEALETSQRLLFDVAKKETKNRLAVYLQKHSGQSEGLIISNDLVSSLSDLISYITANKTDSRVYLSIIHKIHLFERIFNNLTSYEEITHATHNTFDSTLHLESTFITYKLPELTELINNNPGKLSALTDKGVKTDTAEILNYMLRICKFYIEKDGDEG